MLKYAFPAREATVRKIETIIRQQFSLEMKNKDHEIDVISQVFVVGQTPFFPLNFFKLLICISHYTIHFQLIDHFIYYHSILFAAAQ